MRDVSSALVSAGMHSQKLPCTVTVYSEYAKALTLRISARTSSPNLLSIVTFHGKCTRALIFENICQAYLNICQTTNNRKKIKNYPLQ